MIEVDTEKDELTYRYGPLPVLPLGCGKSYATAFFKKYRMTQFSVHFNDILMIIIFHPSRCTWLLPGTHAAQVEPTQGPHDGPLGQHADGEGVEHSAGRVIMFTN